MLTVKIVYCAPGDPCAGAPHGFMAAYWLKHCGYDVQIVCQGGRGTFEYPTPLGRIQVHSLGGGTLKFQFRLFRTLVAQRCGAQTPTVFYLHGHVISPASGLALVGVSPRRIIYHTQDFLEPGRHPHWEFFEARLARKAGQVISNEPNRARFLASHYQLATMPQVARTALPAAWPRPQRDAQLRTALLARLGRQDTPDCRLVMHEGGFASVRCGEQILTAFHQLPENYILIFTGMPDDAPARIKLNKAVRELGLQQRVIALGSLPFDELLRHTACCDLGLLLYPNDGIGNYYQCPGRLTHYLGCGLPVVASNFTGLELLCLKLGIGATCDPMAPASIAEAIRVLGGRAHDEMNRERDRLRKMASEELAYDKEAWRVERAVQYALGRTDE